MDPMAAIRETFFQECEEQLGELESGLMAMEEGGSDTETVNAVFRAVHSIKGGAGAFALDELVRFAHVVETTLDHIRSGRMVASTTALKLLLRAADSLADLVHAARDGTTADEQRVHALADELRELNGSSTAKPGDPPGAGASPADHDDLDGMDGFVFAPVAVGAEPSDQPDQPASPATGWTIVFKPLPALYAKANEAALLMRELARLGPLTVEADRSALPDLAELDPEGAYLSWTVTLDADCSEATVRDVFDFVEDDCVLTISPITPAATAPIIPDMPEEVDIMALIKQAQAAESRDTPVFDHKPPSSAAEIKPKPSSPGASSGAPAADPAARPDAAATVSATIRVDLDRVDRLIDLVGELVINGSMLSQRVSETGLAVTSGVSTALDELEQLTREIQDSVMAIRAQPVRSVFQRMPRLVREVASMTGKQVRLLTDGEGTEVDKTVIERIADPLTHMIRNAIDHGLELPAERVAIGKPAEGVVKLSALHRSGRIVIEVEDDGAGINRERVRAKAIENGVIGADAQLTDEETDNLIFLPGFSTASTVSDISGRGVGMDVVRRSVQALGGRISIVSRPGFGSTFVLSLPLTLAVLDGMVVMVAGHTLIVPLSAMIESLQPRAANLHSLGRDARVMTLRGGCIPVIDVGHVLGYRAQGADAEKSVALLVEGEGGVQAVLLVDAIQGQRQVVIKSLEANYRTIPGIAAATVMGDGRVALILDVDAIVSVTRTDSIRPELGRPELGRPELGRPELGRPEMIRPESAAPNTELHESRLLPVD